MRNTSRKSRHYCRPGCGCEKPAAFISDAELQDQRKQINIISGFLGAGKTTLVNHLLTQVSNTKIDVVIREYGSASIDDRLLNLDKSRIHMYLGMSLHETPISMLYHYLERLYDTSRRHDFDHLLLEASGAESAEDLMRLMYQGNIPMHYKLGSFITVLDAEFGELNLDEYRVAKEQIAFADYIVINRMDRNNQESVEKLIRRARKINPFAEIVCTSFGVVSAETILESDLYSQLSNMSVENTENEEERMENLQTVTLTETEALDREKVNVWIKELFSSYGVKILRGKGFLNFSDNDYRYEFQSVRTTFHSKADQMWQEGEERKSVLVLIGEGLPKKSDLQKAFSACKKT